jgi:hypothetical protein
VSAREAGATRLGSDSPRDIPCVPEGGTRGYLTTVAAARYAGNMLLFKKKFLEAIRTGRKTQTIRLWKHRRMKAGQRSYIPGAGYIRVTAVDEVAVESLTDEDARLDGFETAGQLQAEIAQLYPKQLADGQKAYRVMFELTTE